jgi:hypothetical protein
MRFRRAFTSMRTTIRSLVGTVVFLCLRFLPQAQGVVPPPDGGYPYFTTAEGQNALFSLTTGAANTAVGWFSLKSVTTGSFNTGVGAGTLVLHTGNEKYGCRHYRPFAQHRQRQRSRGLWNASQQYHWRHSRKHPKSRCRPQRSSRAAGARK